MLLNHSSVASLPRSPRINKWQIGKDDVDRMITKPPVKICQVRPHIENKSPGDQSDSPKNSEERTKCASQITARRERVGKRDGDETEAYKAKSDERIIHPKQLPDK